MKKLYNKIMTMNVKKNVIQSIIIGVIFCIIAGAGVGIKFGSRLVSARQQIETIHEENKNSNSDKEVTENIKNNKEDGKKDKHSSEDVEIENIMNFGVSDYIFIGTVLVLGAIIFIYYWLTVCVYAVQKSEKVGTNELFFGVLALFTNIVGVFILHMYISRKRICSKCGKIQSEFSDYCYYCGENLKIKCSNCESVVSADDKYCVKCGTKINK